jgi:hypothetical protein
MVYNRRKIEADYKVRADGSAWDIVTLLRLGPAFQSFRVARGVAKFGLRPIKPDRI